MLLIWTMRTGKRLRESRVSQRHPPGSTTDVSHSCGRERAITALTLPFRIAQEILNRCISGRFQCNVRRANIILTFNIPCRSSIGFCWSRRLLERMNANNEVTGLAMKIDLSLCQDGRRQVRSCLIFMSFALGIMQNLRCLRSFSPSSS